MKSSDEAHPALLCPFCLSPVLLKAPTQKPQSINPLLQGHFHSQVNGISLRTQPQNFMSLPLHLPAQCLHSCSSQTQQEFQWGLSSGSAGIHPSSPPTPSTIWGFPWTPPSLSHFFLAIKIPVQREVRIHL